MPSKIKVYYNWGRWVADCPRDGCGNAERYGVDEMTGVIGGLTLTDFHCQERFGGCGLVTTEVQWPAKDDISAIEILLAPRLRKNRNWVPGESIQDLLTEGLANGLDITNDLRERYSTNSSTIEHTFEG